MKSRNVAKEITSIVSNIEGIIVPLQAAISTLKLANANLSKDPDAAKTLIAVKEARALVHKALKKHSN